MTSRKFALLMICILLNCVVGVFCLILSEYTHILVCMLIWIDITFYCFFNIRKRVCLLTFLIAFFVFLMGREILDVFHLHTIVTDFSEEIDLYAQRLLSISLLSLVCGYVISDHVTIKDRKNTIVDYSSEKIQVYRKVSLVLFYFSMVFSIIRLIDSGVFILQHGYYATYISSSYGMPWAVEKLSDLTPISFYLFLATMPKKSETDKHCLTFAVYLLMTLMTGKRFGFVAGLLVLFVYYMQRNSINSGNVKWLKKKTIAMIILAIPVLSVFLYFIGSARFLRSLANFSFGDALTEFLYGQGVSVHVIKFSYQKEFNPDRFYSLSSIMTFLQKNFVSRAFGVTSYSGNTIENATYGNSLAHALSYYVYGSRYLAGRGTGSCYIAELFHDFGYAGVILANLIYGVVLNRFFRFENMGFFRSTISLILLGSLLVAPRGSADGFVADLVDVTTWSALLFVFIVANLILLRRRSIFYRERIGVAVTQKIYDDGLPSVASQLNTSHKTGGRNTI